MLVFFFAPANQQGTCLFLSLKGQWLTRTPKAYLQNVHTDIFAHIPLMQVSLKAKPNFNGARKSHGRGERASHGRGERAVQKSDESDRKIRIPK